MQLSYHDAKLLQHVTHVPKHYKSRRAGIKNVILVTKTNLIFVSHNISHQIRQSFIQQSFVVFY